MTPAVYDPRSCALGEGPLWHPERQELFWFDILDRRLMSRDQVWDFDEMVSAAGWLDRDHLLIASEHRLMRFALETGATGTLVALEDDQPGTRSNDGRADPWGGFWIGTMGKAAEAGAGAIYRYHRGALRRLVAPLTVPNAICFAPDRSCAYFADSAEGKIFRQALAPADGWPQGAPELFRDLAGEDGLPDGAVVDAQGRIWNAQWGGARVVAYGPDGRFLRSVAVPARHSSCPAFGGAGFDRLFVTSARQGIPADVLEGEPENGQTFVLDGVAVGRPEERVVL